MLTTYNKTINYLRSSHDTGETKGINDIVGNEVSTYGGDDLVTQFSSAMAQEVSKFNKIKRQKQVFREGKWSSNNKIRKKHLMLMLKK